MAKKKAKKKVAKPKTESKKADITKVKDLVDCNTTEEQVGWILQTIEKLYADDYNIEKRLNQRIDRIIAALGKSKSVKGL